MKERTRSPSLLELATPSYMIVSNMSSGIPEKSGMDGLWVISQELMPTLLGTRVLSSRHWAAVLVGLSVVVTTGEARLHPCMAAAPGGMVDRFLSPQMRQLDAEEQTLRDELQRLPPAPTRETTGRLGHHGGYAKAQDTVDWVDLDLRQTHPIDAIVLIATPSDSGGAAKAGYGFPLRFRVEIAEEDRDAGRVVVADHTHEDFANPGPLPVYLPVPGLRARHVRITATRLAREGDRFFFFSLGEVMVLSGSRNVAIGMSREDFGTTGSRGAVPMWGLVNLVDGHIACGPPVGTQASPTLGYQSRMVNPRDEPNPAPRWVQIDLGETMTIDDVRLFPAQPPDFAHRKGFGYPPRAKLELSSTADFSDPLEVPGLRDAPWAPQQLIVNPGDNVVTYNADGSRARYVRFTADELFNANGQFNLALSEMQVWSGGRNIAAGKVVSAFDSTETGGWSTNALVDGFTSTANILDVPGWLSDLSRRREVLQRLAVIDAAKRQLALALQRYGLIAAGAVVLLGGVAAFVWSVWHHRERLREIESLRQRIAQDLHDEIGSSLGSIALIAQDILVDDKHAHEDLMEIKSIADDTVDAMRDITRLIQSDRYGRDDLPLLLRHTADRMLRGIPHTLRIEEDVQTRRLGVERQRDLILIFKEALHNIARHAAATDVDIHLTHIQDSIRLTVTDNGRGFDAATVTTGMGLCNLQRRAEKHNGVATIASAAHGTTFTLVLPLHA